MILDPNEIELTRDVDIQRNLPEENKASSWDNDWDEDSTHRKLPIQEQGIGNEEEINRLKTMIEEIQIENENLKQLNLQNTNIGVDSLTQQPNSVDNYIETETETEIEPTSSDLPATEDNDWNSQMSPIEIPSDEPNISSVGKETIDNETQTEEQSQVNNKLKRALQTMKDKIHQAVTERPELFPNVGEDTIQRLDHLISTIENQATQIDILNDERDNLIERNIQLEKDIQSHSDQPISNDNEIPTEEQSQNKLPEVNNELKYALENIRDKINQVVTEQPELFIYIGADTIERLDHLVSTLVNQVTQIDALQNERDHAQQQVNELQRYF